MSEEAKDIFKRDNYLIIKDFIPPELVATMREYTIHSVRAADHIETFHPDLYKPDLMGTFGDAQAPGSYSKYGDLLMDTIMLMCRNSLEQFVGEDLVANYTYWRMYKTGDILERHKDRYSCDISVTVTLGYNCSNLEEEYAWPICLHSNGEDIEVPLQPGDAVIYRGTELEHWRDEFKGLNHSQVFLHYNKKSENPIPLDGRSIPGIPKGY